MKRPKFSTCSPAGLTLTEVVVSLVIVSTLLVASLGSLNKHLAQATRSHLKSQAVDAAERLLLDWYREGASDIPMSSVGLITGHNTAAPQTFRWKTSLVSQRSEFNFAIVRLQLFSQTEERLANDSPIPLVSVDVAAHLEGDQQ